MEDYLDQFLISSSWPDINDNLIGFNPNSVGSFECDKEVLIPSMIHSDLMVESLTSQESSSVIDNGLLFPGEASPPPPPQNGHFHGGDFSLNGAINDPSMIGFMGLQSDSDNSTLSSLNFGTTNELPMVGNTMRNDFQTPPQIPQTWGASSYEGVASIPPMDKDMYNFRLQGSFADRQICAQGSSYQNEVKATQLANLSAAIPLKTTSTLSCGNFNDAVKPRVRARRGQATDPHSIAERVRREKIAHGLRKLQELVPESNKTDKASMLDEIIEYVKFLQLQLKVLSMNRIGAAEKGVPLITDTQAEGYNSLLPPPSIGQAISSPSADETAMEREVVKLMESNITMAMQYLQRKDLCLMPIALASAISNEKVSPGNEAWNKFRGSDNHVTCATSNQVCPNGCNGKVLKVEDMISSSHTFQEVNFKV